MREHRMKIAVLGGSSPFTAGLVNALVDRSLARSSLALHGRSEERLRLVAHYAEHCLARLGWNVQSSTSIERVLDGADIVLHQIRYGDLQGRADGERLCEKIGVAADETLGPAALLTAIRTVPQLRSTTNALKRHCPDAKVLNLTNPLSAITWAMHELGVRNCVGLCELPLVTVREACQVLEVPIEQTSWRYAGLNHRGFIDSLSIGHRDLLAELPARLRGSDATIGGISTETIEQLEAIPLKYFRLVRNPEPPKSGRAQTLSELRDTIANELSTRVDRSPPSLAKRYMDWYPHSVVPLLETLLNTATLPKRGTTHVLNLIAPAGLVTEAKATVTPDGWQGDFRQSSNRKIVSWVDRFEAHERSFLRAMLDPTASNIGEALEADPIVPGSHVEEATTSLIDFLPSKQNSGAIL